MRTVSWRVAPTPVGGAEARAVLREYYRDIVGRYYSRPATEDEIDAVLIEEPSDDLDPPTGVFLLGREQDVVIGCVGLRIVSPGLAELTRMFVRPSARGRGGASRLLLAAEDTARELGIRTIRLDTRDDLTEARSLYAKHGYTEVEPFNDSPYADHWFRKSLD